MPLGQFADGHTGRVIASATAAALALDGGVAMPPAPPTFSRPAHADPLHDLAMRAAAEAAYELQCAPMPRGASRGGSRVPDFYRAWMASQLEQHGVGATASAAAANDGGAGGGVATFPYGRCPPFEPHARPDGTPGNAALFTSSMAPPPTASSGGGGGGGTDDAAAPTGGGRGRGGDATLRPRQARTAGGAANKTMGKSASMQSLRPSMPPWSPPSSSSSPQRPTQVAGVVAATAAAQAHLAERLHPLATELDALAATLAEHTDDGVRGTAGHASRLARELQGLRAHAGAASSAAAAVVADATAGASSPWQSRAVDPDAFASAASPPGAMRAAAVSKSESARRTRRCRLEWRQRQEPPRLCKDLCGACGAAGGGRVPDGAAPREPEPRRDGPAAVGGGVGAPRAGRGRVDRRTAHVWRRPPSDADGVSDHLTTPQAGARARGARRGRLSRGRTPLRPRRRGCLLQPR